MKHLPTEYTESDQRADTAYLIGVREGRAAALAAVEALANEWGKHPGNRHIVAALRAALAAPTGREEGR